MNTYTRLLLTSYVLLLGTAYLWNQPPVMAQGVLPQTIVACKTQGTGCTFVGSTAIQQAINEAQKSTGNVVEVRAGTYDETLTIGSRSLYIQGAGNAQTIINGSISINGLTTTVIQVEKLSIQNSAASGIRISGFATVLLNKLKVLDHTVYGIDIRDSATVIVKASQISGNTQGIAVSSNKIFNVSNSIVANNREVGINRTSQQMATFQVTHTVLYKNGSHGLKLTVADPYAEIMAIQNSIFMSNGGYGISTSEDPADLFFNTNIIFQNTQGCSDQSTICYAEGTLEEDPLLTQVAQLNMKLLEGSPGIDAGTGTDPDGSPADIGLYGGYYACDYDESLSYCESTPSPVNTQTPSCPLKSQGDANCDGKIRAIDFELWRREYHDAGRSRAPLRANFSGASSVTLADHDIWKNSFVNI